MERSFTSNKLPKQGELLFCFFTYMHDFDVKLAELKIFLFQILSGRFQTKKLECCSKRTRQVSIINNLSMIHCLDILMNTHGIVATVNKAVNVPACSWSLNTDHKNGCQLQQISSLKIVQG